MLKLLENQNLAKQSLHVDIEAKRDVLTKGIINWPEDREPSERVAELFVGSTVIMHEWKRPRT